MGDDTPEATCLDEATPLKKEGLDDSDASSDLEKKHEKGMIALSLSAVVFGINSAFIKTIEMDVLVMIEFRLAFQWLIGLGVVCLIHNGWLSTSGVTKEDSTLTIKLLGPPERRWMLVVWVFGYTAFNFLWYSCLKLLPLGDATAIVYCSPPFAALFAYFLLGEAPKHIMLFLLALPLAVTGVMLIETPPGMLSTPPKQKYPFPMYPESVSAVGIVLASCACITAGLLASLLKLANKGVSMHWSTMEHARSMLGAGLFVPLALAVRMQFKPGIDSSKFSYEPNDWGWLTASAVTAFIGFSLQTWGFQNARAGEGQLMMYVEIPIAMLLQVMIFGRELHFSDVIGSVLVIVAGLLTFFGKGLYMPSKPDCT